MTGYPPLLRHVLRGEDFWPLVDGGVPHARRREWRDQMVMLATTPPTFPELAAAFHTQWHVCHGFLRELLDDDDLMIRLAKAWLPPYQGPDLTLFRGENIDRLEAGRLGSAWTPQHETAEMFAGGLNAVGKGGVLLKVLAPAAAIIAGPSDHSSNWLQEAEYTVDVKMLGDIVQVKRFPSVTEPS